MFGNALLACLLAMPGGPLDVPIEPAAFARWLAEERFPDSRTAGRDLPGPAGRPGWSSPALWEGLDSVIRNDFACNDDTTGGCPQRGPSIALDSSDAPVLSWYEFRDGDADVWFQAFDARGQPLGANQRVNDDATMGWQGDPSSGRRSGGSSVFIWEDRRDFGNSDIFAQRFDRSGNRLGGNFRVSDSGVAGDQSANAVHVAPSGVALCAWDDRRHGITGDIFARMLSAEGIPVDTGFRVNDDPLGYANQYQPAAGGDDSGRFVVAWMDGRGLNPYDWNVFAQRLAADGSRLGSNIQVTTDDSIQWSPGLGVAPDGRFVVCWDDRRRGNQWDVYARRYGRSGQPLGSDFRVNDDPGSADQHSAAAALNRFGEFLVAWTDRRGGDEDVFARLYDSAGAARGPSFRISGDPTGNQSQPAVAAVQEGGYWVAWVDARVGDQNVYLQHYDRDGVAADSARRVNDDRASSLQRVSSIDAARSGVFCVAWEDERNGATDIYRVLLDSTGNPLGPNRRVNDDGAGGADQYYTAVASGRDRHLITWTDGRAGFNIYGQFIDGTGQPIGGNRRINGEGAEALQWYSYCAMDSSNRSVVVWMDTRGGGSFEMYVRFFASDLSPVGPEFRLSDSAGSQYYGSVAMNSTGRTVAVWMDERNGNSDIYAQVMDAEGNRIGPNFRVDGDPGTSYQGYPACAVADDGSFAIAWEDTRNGCYDVLLQWYDSLAVPIGGNLRVPDGPATLDYYSPSCVFDDSSRLLVVFNDERSAYFNPQVMCQRYADVRSRLGGNRLVNEPNAFPNDHHWMVGRSVASWHGVLGFAWTGNRRHQGWDIIGKFTDWEIVGIVGEPAASLPRTASWLMPSVNRGRRFSIAPLPDSARAALNVHDAAGRLAARRLLARTGAERVVSLAGLRPGVYVAVLQSGGRVLRQKLVLQ